MIDFFLFTYFLQRTISAVDQKKTRALKMVMMVRSLKFKV